MTDDSKATTSDGTEKLRLLELFSGTGNLSRIARERGWEAVTVDLTEPADVKADVAHLPVRGTFDLVWASPPCQRFSVIRLGKNWRQGIPRNEETRRAVALVHRTVAQIRSLAPRYYIIENPLGMMRKVLRQPNRTIWYCQYGHWAPKPTDLWGRLPRADWRACHYGNVSCHGLCGRGSKAGTERTDVTASERGRLPDALCHAVLAAVEVA